MSASGERGRGRWAERAGDLLTGWVDRLPMRLRRYLPRDLVGFAMLGAFTFSVDLCTLMVLRHTTRLPLPVAVSIAYLTAFGLNFVLNRTVNFRSHAPVGGQVLRYALVAVGDYLITVGVSSGLYALGLDVRVSRVTAAAVVALFTYSLSRWWVFRDRSGAAPAPGEPATEEPAGARPGEPAVSGIAGPGRTVGE
ncbi:GtrA family protein [Dactylosporangium sp. CA-092794]|uniref:GtrA family protein n=1 Tax=Dactylosporangium sp. CA-092794 TaxID=3239929 RepID=UPI003D8DDAC4